jgi:hypothetical protein
LTFASEAPNAPQSDAPSLFTAIQEQLGLKLDAETVQGQVLVIDHIERPSDNCSAKRRGGGGRVDAEGAEERISRRGAEERRRADVSVNTRVALYPGASNVARVLRSATM